MSTQYCKVGKKRPRLNNTFSLNTVEKKAIQFVETVSKPKSENDFNVVS